MAQTPEIFKNPSIDELRARIRQGKRLYVFDRDRTLLDCNKQLINSAFIVRFLAFIQDNHLLAIASKSALETEDPFIPAFNQANQGGTPIEILPEMHSLLSSECRIYPYNKTDHSLRVGKIKITGSKQLLAGRYTSESFAFQKMLAILEFLDNLGCKINTEFFKKQFGADLESIEFPENSFEVPLDHIIFIDADYPSVYAAKLLGVQAIYTDTQAARDKLLPDFRENIENCKQAALDPSQPFERFEFYRDCIYQPLAFLFSGYYRVDLFRTITQVDRIAFSRCSTQTQRARLCSNMLQVLNELSNMSTFQILGNASNGYVKELVDTLPPQDQLNYFEREFQLVKNNKNLSRRERNNVIGEIKNAYIRHIEHVLDSKKTYSDQLIQEALAKRNGVIDHQRANCIVKFFQHTLFRRPTASRKRLDARYVSYLKR